jgi:hypothetical protein
VVLSPSSSDSFLGTLVVVVFGVDCAKPWRSLAGAGGADAAGAVVAERCDAADGGRNRARLANTVGADHVATVGDLIGAAVPSDG